MRLALLLTLTALVGLVKAAPGDCVQYSLHGEECIERVPLETLDTVVYKTVIEDTTSIEHVKKTTEVRIKRIIIPNPIAWLRGEKESATITINFDIHIEKKKE